MQKELQRFFESISFNQEFYKGFENSNLERVVFSKKDEILKIKKKLEQEHLTLVPTKGYFEGSNLVLINKDKTSYDYKADLVINDSIGKVLKSIKL